MPYLMGGFPDAETSRVRHRGVCGRRRGPDRARRPVLRPAGRRPGHPRGGNQGARGGHDASIGPGCGPRGRRARAGHPDGLREHGAWPAGPRRYASQLADAGWPGRSSPTCPPRKPTEVRQALSAAGLALIPLIAPTTPPRSPRADLPRRDRVHLRRLRHAHDGRAGRACREELGELVRAVQADASVPAAVGFGIGTPEQAAEVGAVADGVIVGSRLVREVAEARMPGAARRSAPSSRRVASSCTLLAAMPTRRR